MGIMGEMGIMKKENVMKKALFTLVILLIPFFSFGVKVDLTIVNPGDHDTPVPAVGVYSINVGELVNAFVTDTVVVETGTTWTCVGYQGTGTLEGSGSETSLSFNIIIDTILTWLWTAQFEVEDFEGYTSGSQVMFRQPSFSGGTIGINGGDYSKVTLAESNNTLDISAWPMGEFSESVYWRWTNSGVGTVRLTTANTDNRPNPMIDFNAGLSTYVLLKTGELDLTLRVRETGGGGPIGSNGGTLGGIESISTAKRIMASADWQYIYWDIPNETWTASVGGNGTLEGDWGTIESFYFEAVGTDPTEAIYLFVDDIYQGPEQTPYFPTPTPTPIYVTDSIQDGIDSCKCGGTQIIVPIGVFRENVRIHGSDLILTSTDPTSPAVVARTIIDGGFLAPVIWLEGTETNFTQINGFTIINGRGLNELGGGIQGNGSHATVKNCVIYNCESDGLTGSGGGINDVDGIIQNNKIINNVSTNIGGGLAKCDGIISNNVINANRAKFGGGLAFCNGIIQNNLIIGNDVETDVGWRGYGGGLYSCDGDINHNTIVFNRANIGGGSAKCVGFLRNSIIWYNTAGRDQSVCADSKPVYSCIMNYTGGEHNIQDEPQFFDWPLGDFSLGVGSPCIGADETGGNMGYK